MEHVILGCVLWEMPGGEVCLTVERDRNEALCKAKPRRLGQPLQSGGAGGGGAFDTDPEALQCMPAPFCQHGGAVDVQNMHDLLD